MAGVTEPFQKHMASMSGVSRKNLPKIRILKPIQEKNLVGTLKYRYEGDVSKLTLDEIQ